MRAWIYARTIRTIAWVLEHPVRWVANRIGNLAWRIYAKHHGARPAEWVRDVAFNAADWAWMWSGGTHKRAVATGHVCERHAEQADTIGIWPVRCTTNSEGDHGYVADFEDECA